MPLTLVTIEHGPHSEVLTHVAERVSFPLSQEDRHLIEKMKEMVTKLNGVGLAAPQVGVAKQIIVYSISDDAKALRQHASETVELTVLINPSYQAAKDTKILYDWEACFSVAEKTGKVPRYEKIIYTAQTPEGETIHANATGFTARVLQHEIDHIKGILIIDRLTPDCIQGTPDEMMSVRFKELNPQQKQIAKDIFAKRAKYLDPNDTAQAKMIEKALRCLSEE